MSHRILSFVACLLAFAFGFIPHAPDEVDNLYEREPETAGSLKSELKKLIDQYDDEVEID